MSPGNSCKICRHASIAVSRTPDPRRIGNWCRLEYNCPSTLAPEGSAVEPSPARFAPLQIGFEKAGLIGAKKNGRRDCDVQFSLLFGGGIQPTCPDLR